MNFNEKWLEWAVEFAESCSSRINLWQGYL